jgi:hypothetical protein
MEEKMTELVIAFTRPERPKPTSRAESDPTALEIQRWEDDGGAPLPAPSRGARCHCAVDHRQRAAA